MPYSRGVYTYKIIPRWTVIKYFYIRPAHVHFINSGSFRDGVDFEISRSFIAGCVETSGMFLSSLGLSISHMGWTGCSPEAAG